MQDGQPDEDFAAQRRPALPDCCSRLKFDSSFTHHLISRGCRVLPRGVPSPDWHVFLLVPQVDLDQYIPELDELSQAIRVQLACDVIRPGMHAHPLTH